MSFSPPYRQRHLVHWILASMDTSILQIPALNLWQKIIDFIFHNVQWLEFFLSLDDWSVPTVRVFSCCYLLMLLFIGSTSWAHAELITAWVVSGDWTNFYGTNTANWEASSFCPPFFFSISAGCCWFHQNFNSPKPWRVLETTFLLLLLSSSSFSLLPIGTFYSLLPWPNLSQIFSWPFSLAQLGSA